MRNEAWEATRNIPQKPSFELILEKCVKENVKWKSCLTLILKKYIKMAKMLKSKFAKNVRNIGENSIL